MIHVRRFEWERILRRVIDLPPSTKLVGLLLATYCNADGSNGRPSLQRLIDVSGTSKSTVVRALKQLRDVGLIVRVFHGSKAGRRGLADVYRLTVPEDLLDRIKLLPPDELTTAEQVPDVTPDPGSEQVPDVTPDRRGTGATSHPEQVSSQTEQVSSQTGTGVTHDTPQEPDHPETRTDHKERLSKVSHSPPATTPEHAAAVAALADLAPTQQEQLLDTAKARLGDSATGTELICYAADLHHNGAPLPPRRHPVDEPIF